jgi:hypothetical protein
MDGEPSTQKTLLLICSRRLYMIFILPAPGKNVSQGAHNYDLFTMEPEENNGLFLFQHLIDGVQEVV